MSFIESAGASTRGNSGSLMANPELILSASFLPTVRVSSSPALLAVPEKITACPLFERLRPTALEDREGLFVKKSFEAKRAEEMRQRRALQDNPATMHAHFATLYRPMRADGPAMAISARQTNPFSQSSAPVSPSSTAAAAAVLPALRARDLILKDIEEFFIAHHYQQDPEALLARRQSSSKRPSASRSAAPRAPPAGVPAANLQVLQCALLLACDAGGLLTRNQIADALSAAPFDMRDGEAIDSFFFAVRTSSTATLAAGAGGSSEAGRPDGSVASGDRARGARGPVGRRPSLASAGVSPAATPAVRRPAAGPMQRRHATPRASAHLQRAALHGAAGSFAGPTGVGAGEEEPLPSPVVRVREVLAAMDELINGKHTRAAVRALCFGIVEVDGYVHKSTLRALRMKRHEISEGRDALVTSSMVKALGDVFEVLLREEEQEYLRSQLKGKRAKAVQKPPALAPHQKTAIPLHMMRRSHINKHEFCRFFDESPQLVAAFAHVWLPAFLATTWPPARPAAVYDDVSIDDDNDDEHMSDGFSSQREGWEKTLGSPITVLGDLSQRRELARCVMADRLESMKHASFSVSDTTA